MLEITDEDFQGLINEAFKELPKDQTASLKNVALLYEYDPTPEQRLKLQLRNDQTLFGLYEGIPLSERQGETKVFPDKITLFKNPLCSVVQSRGQLKAAVKHTLWHEIGHYYGLDHDRIHQIERNWQ